MQETTQQLDLSSYDTAEEAAEAFHQKIRELAKEFDHDPDIEVQYYDADTTSEYRDISPDTEAYTVSWEGGPWEWAIRLLGGVPIMSAEPEVVGFQNSQSWHAEPHYRFDVMFFGGNQ